MTITDSSVSASGLAGAPSMIGVPDGILNGGIIPLTFPAAGSVESLAPVGKEGGHKRVFTLCVSC